MLCKSSAIFLHSSSFDGIVTYFWLGACHIPSHTSGVMLLTVERPIWKEAPRHYWVLPDA